MIQTVVIMSGILAILFWNWKSQTKLESEKEELFEQLEILDRGLNMIGAFLQKIPEMQPQFTIDQNPIGQLLEFIQSMRRERAGVEPAGGILEDATLRDDAGRFSSGEADKEGEGSGSESESAQP